MRMPLFWQRNLRLLKGNSKFCEYYVKRRSFAAENNGVFVYAYSYFLYQIETVMETFSGKRKKAIRESLAQSRDWVSPFEWKQEVVYRWGVKGDHKKGTCLLTDGFSRNKVRKKRKYEARGKRSLIKE